MSHAANSNLNSTRKHSELELLLYPHLMPRKLGGGTVITGDLEDELLNANALAELGFSSYVNPKELKESKFDVYRRPSKKSRVTVNMWDAQNFTSVDNKLPIYPRKTGYVTFDNMSARKETN